MATMIAVVTGATRGTGRGIAVELGAIGATVYCTGRTTRERQSPMKRSETIEETAELVTAAGGRGIPVRCDFMEPAEVANLRDRIESEVDGRLDVLVDDVWGGSDLEHGGPFWEGDLEQGLRMWRNGVQTHLIALHTLVPLVIRRPGGLVVEVTDGEDDENYPGMLFYDTVKASVRRFGKVLAKELAPHECTAIAVTPGFLRSEWMLDHYGVTEQTWREHIAVDPHYAMSETPRYLGRALAKLVQDPDRARWNGKSLASWTLAKEYGVRDLDGSQPDWGRWMAEVYDTGTDPTTVDAALYR
ncbi:SDR family oxidoreductase [Kutzneria albida]